MLMRCLCPQAKYVNGNCVTDVQPKMVDELCLTNQSCGASNL